MTTTVLYDSDGNITKVLTESHEFDNGEAVHAVISHKNMLLNKLIQHRSTIANRITTSKEAEPEVSASMSDTLKLFDEYYPEIKYLGS